MLIKDWSFLVKLRSPEQKRTRVKFCMGNLDHLREDAHLLDKLVCGDESPVYILDPESRTDSKQWLPRTACIHKRLCNKELRRRPCSPLSSMPGASSSLNSMTEGSILTPTLRLSSSSKKTSGGRGPSFGKGDWMVKLTVNLWFNMTIWAVTLLSQPWHTFLTQNCLPTCPTAQTWHLVIILYSHSRSSSCKGTDIRTSETSKLQFHGCSRWS